MALVLLRVAGLDALDGDAEARELIATLARCYPRWLRRGSGRKDRKRKIPARISVR